MRFPLWLTADLALSLIARDLRANQHSPYFLNVNGNRGVSSDVASKIHSPLVWIGGSEPLEHPEIARITSALLAGRRFVFLETNGRSLRRRIHEFQPVSRLYLTIRFDGLEASHDRRAGRDGAYRTAIEALRTAQLCGFLVCANAVVHPATQLEELSQLREQLGKLDLDGLLISSGELTTAAEQRVAEARRRLLSRRWALLSSLLNSGAAARIAKTRDEQHASHNKAEPGKCEEGAQA